MGFGDGVDGEYVDASAIWYFVCVGVPEESDETF
jgi:hypothetical protein